MATRTAPRPLHRTLGFLAGVGFAAVPAVGPFFALLAIAAGKMELQRADRWWWLSAALLGLPLLLTGHAVEAVAATAQVIAVWLIFRSATEVRRSITDVAITNDVGAGLIVGLFVTLTIGLRQFDGFRWETARTLLDAVAFQAHPAIFGHTMLVLAALLAVVVPAAGLRALALALGAIGVVLSGAREAIFVWLVVAVALRFAGRRGSLATNVTEWVLIGSMLLIGVGAFNSLGLGRTGFVTALAPGTSDVNLLRGTEIAEGDWWYPLGVGYVATPLYVEGQPRTGMTVTKQWTEPWARLQQVVTLKPQTTYTLSAVLRPYGGAVAGFDGWGQSAGDAPTSALSTQVSDGTHRATTTGAITVLTTSATALDDDMLRAQVTFRYDGERPLVWYVGVVPDRSALTGATTTFAEVQLREADSLLPYVPGFAERGVTSLRASRLPVWEDALAAISARPLLGWGPNGLATAVNDLMPLESRLRPVAAHAHNMLLAVWVDRGLVGVIGLIVLVAVIGLRAVQQRDRPAVIVIGGALVLNLFDATLLSGTIIYPLAAVLGWRAVGHRRIATAETGVGSAAAVRVSLAVGDMAAGAIALSIGMLFASRFDPQVTLASGWSPALAYATLVWPLVAGWSGLYPGYGLPAHRELAKSVQSAGAASLLIAFATLFLPDTIPLPTGAMVIAALTSVILAPMFRALIKHMLRALHIWGRAIVMLGNGTAAQRTVSHLIEHPSVGLYPVAAFGDGATWAQERLPLTGALEHAWRYIEDNNIRHAIVTPDAALELGFDEVLRRADRQLRYVQYLPDLKGLPSSSVVATPLGTFLALEVRNQLASGTNRAVKRIIDLLVASTLLVLLAVPLLLIALLVRLDSKGHPLHLSPRVGRYGKTFACIKFRTMHLDAQQRLEHILATDPERQTEYEQFRKLSRDPRVTRVGRVLRRLSLDEFPQLINVVLGQMSLVGPRPYLVSELDAMGPDRDLIFLARPGMTGYWQIEARNDVSFEERQAMEADYVRNWSVWWDISILLATPLAMLGPDGK